MIEEQEEVFEFEYNSDSDYIQAAYFAISIIDDIDMEMASTSMRERVKRIRRNAIIIADHCLKNLYNNLFENEED